MKLTDEQFCQIESSFSGEHINKVEQLSEARFTGRELKEYLEHAITYYNKHLELNDKQSIDFVSFFKWCTEHNFENNGEKIVKDYIEEIKWITPE